MQRFPTDKYVYLIYFISNILILVSSGVWWDDWTIFNPDYDILYKQFVKDGSQFFMGYFHLCIAKLINTDFVPLFYHILSFFTGLLVLIYSNRILNLICKKKSINDIVLILLACTPFFSSRITMACYIYILVSLLYLQGTYFFLKYRITNRIKYRIYTDIFWMMSLFVWLYTIILIPVTHILLSINKEFSLNNYNIKNLIKRLYNEIDIQLIPIISIIIRYTFFPPSGAYTESYGLSLGKILSLPLNLLYGVYGFTIQYFKQIIYFPINDVIFVFITITVLLLSIYISNKILNNDLEISNNTYYKSIILSIILYLSIILPTIHVGPPSIMSYNSRYYALASLPISYFISYTILYVFKSNLNRLIVLSLFITYNILVNINLTMQFQKSWMKDEAIISIFKKEEIFQRHDLNIFIIDNCKNFNPYYEDYRYYEFTGMYKLAWNKQDKFISSNLVDEKSDNPIVRYNCNDSKNIGKYNFKLYLYQNNIDLTYYNTFKLMCQYYFNNDSFKKNISQILNYRIEEYNVNL